MVRADTERFFEAARALAARLYPGAAVTEVKLVLSPGGKIVLPVPLAPAVPEPESELTPFQLRILEALDGKAMRTDALGAEVGDRGRLFKKGGIKELRERGLVELDPDIGYYRPDRPPS